MLFVIAGYLVLTIGIGLALARRVKRASDYLIAGRRLGFWLTTASLAAVQIGAGIVMGGAETGAQAGFWPGTWYAIGCGGGLILGGLVAAGRLREQGGYVPIDYFAARYGERRWVRVWAWLSNLPSLLGIFAAQLMAAGSVLQGFGLEFRTAVLLIAAVILVSNALSGMWGVVAVDFMQVMVILVGLPIAALAALRHPGAPDLTAMLATSFVPTGMGSRAIFLITPFLFSISVSYDAFIRYQAAESAAVARRACLAAGGLVIVVGACASIIGTAGKVVYPEVNDGAVLTHLVRASLPPAVAGIVVAALLAAAMSTANALLVSMAGCFSRDFYNKVLHPTRELDDLPWATTLVRVAAIGSLVLGVAIALMARGILDTIIIFTYPYMASMLVPLLGGLLWAGATRTGAFAAMAVGGAIGVVGFLAALPGPLHGAINIDLALLTAFAASAIVLVVVSLTGRRRVAT